VENNKEMRKMIDILLIVIIVYLLQLSLKQRAEINELKQQLQVLIFDSKQSKHDEHEDLFI
jgi:hypothetical protein